MAGSIGRASVLTGALMIGLATAQAADFTVIESKDPKLHFKSITLPDGKSVTYTHGSDRARSAILPIRRT